MSFQLTPAKYSLATEFGLDIDPAAMITGYEAGHDAAPNIEMGYVFQKGKMRDLLAFWTSPLKALKIKGDPATGKTSLVEQWHARLRWPLRKVACSRSTESYRLIGHLVPTADMTLKWVDGPVTAAAREGTSVLLDEYNTMDPDQATGLNLLLEGKTFTIEETGEMIRPMPGFRVFATENAVHSKLSVAGRNVHDVANKDRWMVMHADYLEEALEIQAVYAELLAVKVKPVVADMHATQIVQLANQVRKAYRDGVAGIDEPMSTRTAIRWAILTSRYGGVTQAEGGPMIYALHRAFDMSEEMAPIVETYTKTKLGIAA